MFFPFFSRHKLSNMKKPLKDLINFLCQTYEKRREKKSSKDLKSSYIPTKASLRQKQKDAGLCQYMYYVHLCTYENIQKLWLKE